MSPSDLYDDRRSANMVLVATFCGIFGLVAVTGIVVLLWKRCLTRSVREEKRLLSEMKLKGKEREIDGAAASAGGYNLGGVMRVAEYPGPRATLTTVTTSTILSPPAARVPAPYSHPRGGDAEMPASEEKKRRRWRGWWGGESARSSGYGGGGDEECGGATSPAETGPVWGVTPPWDVADLYDPTRPTTGADSDGDSIRPNPRRITLPGTMSRTLPKIVAQTPHRGGVVGGPGYRPSVRRGAKRESFLARGRARSRFDPDNVI